MDTTFSISFALPLRISVETGFFIDYSVFPKICKNDFRKQQQQSLIHLFSEVHIFREGHKNMMKSANFFDVTKGQIISKRLFGILGFFQKTNERIRFFCLTVLKTNLFVCFFGRIRGYQKVFSKLSDL